MLPLVYGAKKMIDCGADNIAIVPDWPFGKVFLKLPWFQVLLCSCKRYATAHPHMRQDLACLIFSVCRSFKVAEYETSAEALTELFRDMV